MESEGQDLCAYHLLLRIPINVMVKRVDVDSDESKIAASDLDLHCMLRSVYKRDGALTICMLCKKFSRRLFEIFLIFPRK